MNSNGRHTLEPHNVDAEVAVLGSCLIDRDAVVALVGELEPMDLFERRHKLIFRAMLDLYDRRTPADIVNVIDELERRGALEEAGGEAYLAELIASTPTAVHAPYYAQIVKKDAGRRRLIAAGTEIVQTAFDRSRDWDEALANAEAALRRASEGGPEEYPLEPLRLVVEQYIGGIDTGPGRLTTFGYRGMDEMVDGMEDGDLAIIAGRPSNGKTAFALGIARHVAARLGRTVGIVSLETRAVKLLHRILAQETGIDSRKIARGGLALDDVERQTVEDAASKVGRWPLFVDGSGSGRVQSVVARVRSLHGRQGLDLLIVDGLWLMEWPEARDNRVREVGKITRMMKLLAMELEIPIVLLHQLSRASAGRKDPTPVLTDLRESGDVEQDADWVVFVHRPGLIDMETDPKLTRIIVAKNRNGPIGKLSMLFEPVTTTFYERRLEMVGT